MPSRGCWPRTAPVALAAVPRASISASPRRRSSRFRCSAAALRRRNCAPPLLLRACLEVCYHCNGGPGSCKGSLREGNKEMGQKSDRHAKKGSSDAPFLACFSRLQPWAFLRENSKLTPESEIHAMKGRSGSRSTQNPSFLFFL